MVGLDYSSCWHGPSSSQMGKHGGPLVTLRNERGLLAAHSTFHADKLLESHAASCASDSLFSRVGKDAAKFLEVLLVMPVFAAMEGKAKRSVGTLLSTAEVRTLAKENDLNDLFDTMR